MPDPCTKDNAKSGHYGQRPACATPRLSGAPPPPPPLFMPRRGPQQVHESLHDQAWRNTGQ
ncbi:hypothetical protein [Acetobacter syzygii]|uniref:hypothetical protein n=1 Tax=Acetobacter syzygii TaxID=146476 RepID=UPI000AAEB072|nr:hypothetical protein [Acetobacter syzygii]